jgi:tRNA threonylcarbamoyladenosine biosynthesis protein TsaE
LAFTLAIFNFCIYKYNNIKKYIIPSEAELPQVIKQIINDLKYSLILFIGDLGAGKTTSIKYFLKELKCEDAGSSPSYSIINEYKADNNKIYHIDLYRLEDAQEAFNLGIEDYLYSGYFCFVEWPQIIFDYLEEPYHIFKIEIQEDNSRLVTLA